jgi:hypothetical protein
MKLGKKFGFKYEAYGEKLQASLQNVSPLYTNLTNPYLLYQHQQQNYNTQTKPKLISTDVWDPL